MRDLKLIAKHGKVRYYAYKPLQKVLPKLTEADYNDLKEDIRKNGLRETIKVVEIGKNRYVVLDGVHRLKIVTELGMVPKLQTGEVKEEDWFRIGLVLNVSAKRGRQLKKRDLVKKLYEQYKKRKTGAKPSIDEFRKELETYGLRLTEKSIRTYLFSQHKPEHHGQQMPPPRSASNSTQRTKNAHISTISQIAVLFNTDTNSLVKTLRELAPKLDFLSKQFGRSRLEILKYCVEAVESSLTEKG